MSKYGPMLRHCCLKEDYDLYIRSVLKRAIIDSRQRHISLKKDNKFLLGLVVRRCLLRRVTGGSSDQQYRCTQNNHE